tara:strand:- start:75 stop:368 length:294 start_codon:yes stop_codon:yes gene_type:complete
MQDTAIRNTHPTVVTIAHSSPLKAWDDNGDLVVLDESAITTEVNRLQAAYDALEYSRLRKAKYDLLNQDEMRFDDVKNSTTTWVDAIDAIKAAHPKP